MENPGELAGSTGAKGNDLATTQESYPITRPGATAQAQGVQLATDARGRLNRFEWFKAVMQSDVSSRAKTLAGALAVEFANDETGQINPSINTLAEYLRSSPDTIRRAIAELGEGGWLVRTIGRGRGRKSGYAMVSPGNVVPFHPGQRAESTGRIVGDAPQKRSHDCDLSGPEKGGNPAGKRSQNCNPHIRQEQSIEQKGRAGETGSPRPTSRPGFGTPALTSVDRGVKHRAPPALPAISHQDAEEQAAMYWGKSIREGGYVPPNAVSARIASLVLHRGYATEDQMRAKGIRP